MSSKKYKRERLDQPGGRAYEPEAFELLDGMDVTGIGAGARYRPVPAQPPAQPQERSWGEAIADAGVQSAEGVNTTLGSFVNLFSPSSGVADFFRSNGEHWRKAQSPVTQRKLAEAEKVISAADQDSIIEQSIAAARAYSSDPVLISRFIFTNLPSVLPGLGASRVGQIATLAAGGSTALAAAAGTTMAGATEALMNAGGARGKAFEEIRDTQRKQSVPEDEAVRIALGKSVMPAAIGSLTGLLPGKRRIERALAGRGYAATGALASAMLGKQLDDVLPQVATNHQAGEVDGRPLSRNVGRTAVEAAVSGLPPAGVAAIAARRGHARGGKAGSEGDAALPVTGPESASPLRPGSPAAGDAGQSALEASAGPARPDKAVSAVPAESGRGADGEAKPQGARQRGQVPADAFADGDAPAFDPATVQARNWLQFVSERGENIGRLRRGTPAWELLQDDWKAVQAARKDASAGRTAPVDDAPVRAPGDENAAARPAAPAAEGSAPVPGSEKASMQPIPGAQRGGEAPANEAPGLQNSSGPPAAVAQPPGPDGGLPAALPAAVEVGVGDGVSAADAAPAAAQPASRQDADKSASPAPDASMGKVKEVADAISASWTKGPPVRVMFDLKEPRLAQAMRDAGREPGADGGTQGPRGFYADGQLHLLANASHTPAQVARVVYRQALGQHGLQGAFGEGMDAVLDQIVAARPRDVREKAQEHGLAEGREGRRAAAQDVLAAMAEQSPQAGFVRKAVEAVRLRLRAQLPSIRPMAMSDARIIEDFILPARDWVRRGGQPAGNSPPTAMAAPHAEADVQRQRVDAQAYTGVDKGESGDVGSGQ
ncbi:hypothetical protein [Delftia acidovorans]|uniref:hypothetical protein n=1 Tax=Delftia acidovorans TaxID=80866 RepID=UPI000BD17DC5|nr:hypothetical protein [Delftia acidovorans]SOE37118.1 hypothetical protein SAMN05216519_3157 [Delftia acidovorans]